MMRTKYSTLIDKFVNRYNKDHIATKIKFIEENKKAYIINQFGDVMAKASSKQDLAIMLCLCEDTRTKKNEDYWMNSQDKWEYNSLFLNELMTRYRGNR